jgi:hypothetical protein
MSRQCICGHVNHRVKGGGCLTPGCKCSKLRCYSGMNLSEFAVAVGASRAMMSRFFNGKRRLSPELFRRVAEALGVSAEQLLVEADGFPGGVFSQLHNNC